MVEFKWMHSEGISFSELAQGDWFIFTDDKNDMPTAMIKMSSNSYLCVAVGQVYTYHEECGAVYKLDVEIRCKW